MWWVWLACTPKTPVESAVEAGAAQGSASPPVEESAWQTSVYADHSLVGRIWSTQKGAFISEEELVADLKAAQYVLLGEKHDNPDHHQLQAKIVGELSPEAVAFEMLDHKDPVADAKDPASLAAAAGWAESGWPDFSMYEPIFATAFTAGARIVPAHPTRDEVRSVMSSGMEALPPEAVTGLALDPPLDEALLADLSEEIVQSHCGHASPEIVDKMIRAQILKDAWMARAMAGARTDERPVVLIAGGGHTRNDRGVPHYLQGEHRTVLFQEVRAGQEEPAPYDEAADYLWFTPRVDDQDPCDAFREQLQHMKAAPAPVPPPEPQ